MLEFKGKCCKDCKVFVDDIDDAASELIKAILDNSAFEDAKVRIMPDTHAGKGIVIGFTAPLREYVNPDHVGVDIGCTIDTWFTDVRETDLSLVKLESDIRDRVKFGKELHEDSIADAAEFCGFVQKKMDLWHSTWPEMIQRLSVDRHFVLQFCNKIGIGEQTFWNSLGTVGSGNHFIEVGTEPVRGMLAFTIHCGSRNLGVKIAKYHSKVAKGRKPDAAFEREMKEMIARYKEEGRANEIAEAIKTMRDNYRCPLPDGYLSGKEMADYFTDMAIGVAYALYNHKILSRLVLDAFRKQIVSAEITDMVRSIHNYVDFTDHIISKGAVRSYEGERMVIPFNMRDGLAICRGKSNADWNCSAPHGAGRIMSRAEAIKKLSVEDFARQMEGIVSTSVGKGTIDEAPDAYKDTAMIMSLIKDTCDIEYLIKPLINLKDRNTSDD